MNRVFTYPVFLQWPRWPRWGDVSSAIAGMGSAALTDQITTAAALQSPGNQFSLALFYWPDHSPTGSDTNTVVNIGDAGSVGRAGLLWDQPTSGNRAAWRVNTTTDGAITLQFPTAPAAHAWSHLGITYGTENDATKTLADLIAYQAGSPVVTASPHSPVNAVAAALTLWKDIYGDDSPLGQIACLAFWEGICLRPGEMMYLANGGHPLSVRTDQKNACLKLFIPGAPAKDAGPAGLTLTTTGGSRKTVSGLTFLPQQQTLGRVPYMFCHRGPSSGSPNTSATMFAAENPDGTLLNWEFRSCHQVPAATLKAYRDPDAVYDPVTGAWYSACINEGVAGQSSSWDLYKSWDGNEWGNPILSVDCSAITGTSSTAFTFKPRFFFDADGSIHVVVVLSADGTNFYNYLQTPSNRNDLSQAWGAPAKTTGTSLPPIIFDTQLQKEAGTYYLTYVNSSNHMVEVMSSTSINSGYTVIKSGDWALWTVNSGGEIQQGPSWAHRADGIWGMLLDQSATGNGVRLSVSNIAGTFAQILAGATFSVPTLINFHGKPTGTADDGTWMCQGPTMRSPPVLPSPPSTVPGSLAAVGGYKQAALSWAAVTGATRYKIYRGTASGAEKFVGTTGSTSYIDYGTADQATAYYKVSAANAGGEGPLSGEVSTTTTAYALPAIGSLVLDLSSDAGLLQTAAGSPAGLGQPVGQWLAQSGTSLNANQTTSAKRPIVSSVNGMPSVLFDGVSQFMNIALTLGQPMTIVVVAQLLGDGNLYRDDAGNAVLFSSSGVMTEYAGSATVAGFPRDAGLHVYRTVWNGASTATYKDGMLIIPVGNPGSAGVVGGSFNIGAGSSGGAPINGHYTHVTAFGSASQTDGQALDQTFRQKYGAP